MAQEKAISVQVMEFGQQTREILQRCLSEEQKRRLQEEKEYRLGTDAQGRNYTYLSLSHLISMGQMASHMIPLIKRVSPVGVKALKILANSSPLLSRTASSIFEARIDQQKSTLLKWHDHRVSIHSQNAQAIEQQMNEISRFISSTARNSG